MSRQSLRWNVSLVAATLALVCLATPRPAMAGLSYEEPEISGGGQAALNNGLLPLPLGRGTPTGPDGALPGLLGTVPGVTWEGIDFFENAVETGFFQIPPDPIGAAGLDRNIDVVNSSMSIWNKTGTLIARGSLFDLFVGTPNFLGTTTFDPKVVWDEHANRFVIVTLEATGSPQASRVLLAVSKTASPATVTPADWWTLGINSTLNIAGQSRFADYPGFEVDEDAVYVTANMFNFAGTNYAGPRLWIVHKGLVGGFYGGGAATVTLHDFITATPGAIATTTMPSLIHGAAGAGPGIGTYLVSYNGISDGTNEFLQVIRVNDPLGGGGGPTFVGDFVPMGNIDTASGSLPRTPQLGSAIVIDTGDRRTQDAVWRNNRLYVVFEINPEAGDPENGQCTVHWVEVSTSGVIDATTLAGALVLNQQGDLGGNDHTPGASTSYPSVAVNPSMEVKVGHSIGGAAIYAAAAVNGRKQSDPPNTMRGTELVHAGVDSYVRTFTAGTGRNRWGDYSGTSVDPADPRVFWIFNEFAWTHGNPTTVSGVTEDGRWKTVWYSCAFPCFNIVCPARVDAPRGGQSSVTICITNCGPFADTFDYTVSDAEGWCGTQSGSITLAAGGSQCVTILCDVPANAVCDLVDMIITVASEMTGEQKECRTELVVDCSVPTRLAMFDATPVDGGALIQWEVSEGLGYQGFHIYREAGNTGRERVTQQMLTGQGMFEFVDHFVSTEPVRYWLAEIHEDGSSSWHGPVVVQGVALPTALSFGAPRPNPFSATTTLVYTLPSARNVRMTVVDMAGRKVATLVDGAQTAGPHSVTWDGRTALGERAPTGIYMILLNAGGELRNQKVLLGR